MGKAIDPWYIILQRVAIAITVVWACVWASRCTDRIYNGQKKGPSNPISIPKPRPKYFPPQEDIYFILMRPDGKFYQQPGPRPHKSYESWNILEDATRYNEVDAQTELEKMTGGVEIIGVIRRHYA
jgi:hypothetical protein